MDIRPGMSSYLWCLPVPNKAQQLKAALPNEYNILSMDADVLPGNAQSIVHPFLSLVVNLNVATLAHRDRNDKTICVVLVLGDHVGGDLCLYEAGLVIPLKTGDFVAFPSARLTHFNLHFIGQHASIVLHTDREIEAWTNGHRNGWVENEHFQ